MNYNNYYFPFILNRVTPTDLQKTDSGQLYLQNDTIYSFPDNLSNALAIIQEAVSGESEDRAFYTYLSEVAPSEEEKQIISGIRDNEISHHHMFSQLYHDITKETVPQHNGEQFIPPSSYCEGLKNAILGEQRAVQKYRQVLFAMQTHIHINMMTEIITDEIRHGSLYNYLYAKNRCDV